jgi:kinesin family protein 5
MENAENDDEFEDEELERIIKQQEMSENADSHKQSERLIIQQLHN